MQLFLSVLIFNVLAPKGEREKWWEKEYWSFKSPGGHEAPEILAPQLRTEPAPPALEGKVLTTGLPGNSLSHPLQWKGRGWVLEGSHPVTSHW